MSSGFWAVGCTALVDEVAAGKRLLLFILPREKKKKDKRAAAEDLSLDRPLAPSSVLLLEMQTEMLFCVLPFALLSPTPWTVFE